VMTLSAPSTARPPLNVATGFFPPFTTSRAPRRKRHHRVQVARSPLVPARSRNRRAGTILALIASERPQVLDLLRLLGAGSTLRSSIRRSAGRAVSASWIAWRVSVSVGSLNSMTPPGSFVVFLDAHVISAAFRIAEAARRCPCASALRSRWCWCRR
jgi:hypothetical protein